MTTLDEGAVPSAEPWSARYHAEGAQALYLHVPFCVRKCAYCDFASWGTDAADPVVDAYLEALLRQLGEARELGLLEGCRTAYVGGGTPTLLGARRLARLVRAVRDAAPGLVELTCEANPDSLGDDVLSALVDAGATRVSIGVQSLDDHELAALGRVHDAACARDRVAAAVATGLDVSCDLMCAIPYQTDWSWGRTVREAIGLGVGHVSVYPLAIEEGTPLARRCEGQACPWNDGDVQARRMVAARDLLREAGFARYEVASHARPGHRCQHNVAYWTGRPYLGLGVGASSMLTREGYERLRGLCRQLPVAPDGDCRVRITWTCPVADGRAVVSQVARHPSLASRHADLEFLTPGQTVAEDLMLGCRLVDGASPQLVALAREALGGVALEAATDDVVRRGLARGTADGGLAPAGDSGWLLGNELFEALWDLAPGTIVSQSC